MHGVVEVRGGRVRGVERGGVWSFSRRPVRGLPGRRAALAAAGAPRAVGRHPRLRPVRTGGPAGPGIHGPGARGRRPRALSEDCLNLNVWTPGPRRRPAPGHGVGPRRVVHDRRPGRPASTGAGCWPATDDVVVVTINYRLGLLGFLAHPGARRAGPDLARRAGVDGVRATGDWPTRWPPWPGCATTSPTSAVTPAT